VQQYAREARVHLPAALFRPVPQRLLWLPIHLGIIAAIATWTVATQAPWYLALPGAVIAGHSWACLAFLAHETLHHAVVRNRLVEKLVGYCGLGLFCLSPTLWVAWHNQAHHGNTGNPDHDPDAYSMWHVWEQSAVDRALVTASPGSGRKRTFLYPFFTFSVHSAIVLLSHSERDNYYARISRRTVYLETAAMFGFWLALLLAVGAWNFLFIALVPALIANGVSMSYIATNHFLNPLTAINDPLVNSLSVRGPRLVEWLHLQFGYHVEPHIFPTVSARHGRVIRDALVRLYGDRYLTLPHARALRLLYTRPKTHDTHDTLFHPQTRQALSTSRPAR
jgi:fatty acid desaturase